MIPSQFYAGLHRDSRSGFFFSRSCAMWVNMCYLFPKGTSILCTVAKLSFVETQFSNFLILFPIIDILNSVGPVPETSVPIRFRVLQFEDRFDSGSYLTSRPRFRVGSGRVYGSSICIF